MSDQPDLMAALKASLDTAKKRRCGCGQTRGILWDGAKWVCGSCASKEKHDA